MDLSKRRNNSYWDWLVSGWNLVDEEMESQKIFSSPQEESIGYNQKAGELRNKQESNYYKRLEEQQKRNEVRELRRRTARRMKPIETAKKDI